MLSVRGLSKRFGTLQVLRDISFTVNSGEVVVILGRSGSGKSTLLRCINFLEPVDAGEIWIAGEKIDPRRSNLQRLRQGIGFVFQHFNLFPHLTALGNVTLALRVVKRISKDEAQEIGMKALSQVGLAAKASSYPEELSGGQQQRVAIARALAMNPDLMLFDEPTSALDPELIGEVLNVMESLAGRGMTMIVVTHEMGFAQRVADRALFMHEGRIVEEAAPAELFSNPRTEEARSFIGSIL
ncbi:MAG TPA: amino acid ABC transporter ATP-binding protein [Firmicutes bacterium]|nr:amino acid ABC transporter ATP-binding protein [Bacillota bacterium]